MLILCILFAVCISVNVWSFRLGAVWFGQGFYALFLAGILADVLFCLCMLLWGMMLMAKVFREE